MVYGQIEKEREINCAGCGIWWKGEMRDLEKGEAFRMDFQGCWAILQISLYCGISRDLH